MAMKLLEKDVFDKQDCLVTLREQLDNVKAINHDIYEKLQVRRLSHDLLIEKKMLQEKSFLRIVAFSFIFPFQILQGYLLFSLLF